MVSEIFCHSRRRTDSCCLLVGVTHAASEIRAANDAVIMATGATWPRDLRLPNRNLDGIHFAMEFLRASSQSGMSFAYL